ncbi:bifunctional nuclease family protein [Pontibacter sp. E15-1]|uniref:bifunctional nuclease family protein n=1 Tax=Pontibacter sp. E15-1 TaxID=2919918 RepID=UPI001F4FD032|nr:bifunctional nuclease family protein [Pontibacter sp. E15-1]MCJ8164987.1 bifunctional nuclease family protein [Pontibacter sp. E15-1]
MEKIQLEILGLSSSQSQTGSFALVLGEREGNRRLPIIIGMFEAQSIAIQIEKINPNRPLTHDLFKTFAEHMDVAITEILISDLKEGVFYSKIMCTDGTREFELDSRPSDAIAIGLRFGVPIYTVESVLSEAGIILSDLEDGDEENEEMTVKSTSSTTSSSAKESLSQTSVDELNKLLNDALDKEDYERAAKIRDELNKRN